MGGVEENDSRLGSARRGAGTLWALTAGQRARYAAAIVAMGLGSIFLLMVPLVLECALDALGQGFGVGDAFHDGSAERTLVLSALAIVGFNILHGLFTFVRGKWAAEASEGIVRRLRHELYAHLERLPSVYHDKADTGDLVQRCSSDVETVRVFLAAQVVEIARVTLFLAIAVPIMLAHDWRMSLVSLAIVPVLLVFAVLFFRKVRDLFKAVDESDGRLTTLLQENLMGIRVVRAFGQQDFEISRFHARNGELRDLEWRLFVALSNYWALSDVLIFTQLGMVLVGGAYFALTGAISIGEWVFFTFLVRTIIWPVRQIGRVLVDSGKASVSIDRIQAILGEPVESEEAVPERPVGGDIEVRDLTFRYNEGPAALDRLSLSIRSGEAIALFGPPGSGKSTLMNLLVRLYDYQEGSIKIGGRELKELNRDAVRGAFGMVLQDPFLYSRTVRENVAIGHSSAADHEVEESARAADVHENIMDFADGYATVVGERGVTLSGGQRQRVAIARALLMDPTFLVLDDSLSAVDTKTESRILRALAARKGKQTTILIAHRLSSARLADRIFVLEGGRLVQEGTHEELSVSEGLYRRLWEIQGALEEEIERDLTASAAGTEGAARA
jgi:ATP-binding cassette, subfamily B, bacterial